MAKQDITLVTASDTFQLWLDKTNVLVDLMNTDIMTASITGDTTVGNANLTGTFTAEDLIANTNITTTSLSTVSIVNKIDPVDFVEFTSPISILSTQEKLLVLKSSSQKPAINLINNGNANWNVTLGTVATDSPFVIETEGRTTPQFTLLQNGNLILGGSLTANSITASVSGNATTATRLAAPVNINGVAFNGSASILINTNFALSRATTNSYLLGDTFNGSAAVAWSVDATSVNTANKVVARDGSGNFTAGTITATLSGNATSLTGLTTTIEKLNYADTVTSNIQGQFNSINTSIGTINTSIGTINTNIGTINTNINLKANIASPAFTGTPTAPTATATTNSTQIATTAFVRAAVNTGVGSVVIPAPVVFPTGSTQGNGISISAGGTIAMTGSYTGNFSVTGAITASGNVTAFSDERLKSNIRTIDNAVDKVSLMRGVYFDKDGATSTGVIAQEMEKVLPEVVFDGEYKSVAYGNIVGILIEAIKELKNEIELLKQKV